MFQSDDFAFVDVPKEEPVAASAQTEQPLTEPVSSPEAVTPTQEESKALDPAAEALRLFKESLEQAKPKEEDPKEPEIAKPTLAQIDSIDFVIDPETTIAKAVANELAMRDYNSRVETANRAKAQSALDAAIGANSRELAQDPSFSKFLSDNEEVNNAYRKAVADLDVSGAATVLKLYQVVQKSTKATTQAAALPEASASTTSVTQPSTTTEGWSDQQIADMSPEEWDKNKAKVLAFLSNRSN
jgi:hypothetical protein